MCVYVCDGWPDHDAGHQHGRLRPRELGAAPGLEVVPQQVRWSRDLRMLQDATHQCPAFERFILLHDRTRLHAL
jgi:hypothetical protein